MGQRESARARVIRSLRALREFERRVQGGISPVWDEYFSLKEGARVRYPLVMMVVFDHDSRQRAIDHYLESLWSADPYLPAVGADSATGGALRSWLGLGADASSAEVREAFRRAALETHPDQGGDAERMRELLELYSAFLRERA